MSLGMLQFEATPDFPSYTAKYNLSSFVFFKDLNSGNALFDLLRFNLSSHTFRCKFIQVITAQESELKSFKNH